MTERIRAALPLSGDHLHALLLVLLVGLAALLILPPGRLPYPPDSQFSDATLAHWPNAFFLRQSVWRFGQWPLWRPTSMLGAPFAANPLTKVWYPPQWLALIPILPITLTLNLLVYAHLILAALGMLAWARASRLSALSGTVAGLAYSLTPKVLAHLGAGHLDLVYAAAWAAWLLWALRRLADNPTLQRAALVGVIAALMALADLRFAAYLLVVAALYGLIIRSPLRPSLFAALIFFLLMSVYIAPLLALRNSLTRAAITPTEAAIFSLPPARLLGLLVAESRGFHEWMTYLGLPVIALAILALRRPRREVWFFWGLVILATLYSLGDHTPLYPAMVRNITPLRWLRVPSRAWFVVAFSMACLTAYGAQILLDGGLASAGRLVAVGTAVLGLSLAIGALTIKQPLLVASGLALLGTGAGLFVSVWPKTGPRGALLALSGVLLASLLSLGNTLVEGRREAEVFLADWLPLSSEGRLYSPSFSVLPHEAERSGQMILHGVDPFQLIWSAAAINEAAGVGGQGYSITAPRLPNGDDTSQALSNTRPNLGLLAALGVNRIASTFPLENDRLLELEAPQHTYQLEDARPLVYLTESNVEAPLAELQVLNSQAELLHWTPNKVTVMVQPSERSLLVITQAWAPGWQASVDGRRVEVQRVGGVLQAVALNAGARQVELVYRPIADLLGLAISAVTALSLIAWRVFKWRSAK